MLFRHKIIHRQPKPIRHSRTYRAICEGAYGKGEIFMQDHIEKRARKNAAYIAETGCTVRTCAAQLGYSKSTVHKDVTERIALIDKKLYISVKRVLDLNLSERHLRGGNATRQKYERMKQCTEHSMNRKSKVEKEQTRDPHIH